MAPEILRGIRQMNLFSTEMKSIPIVPGPAGVQATSMDVLAWCDIFVIFIRENLDFMQKNDTFSLS